MYSRVIFLTNEKYITKEECVYDFEKIKVEAEKINILYVFIPFDQLSLLAIFAIL